MMMLQHTHNHTAAHEQPGGCQLSAVSRVLYRIAPELPLLPLCNVREIACDREQGCPSLALATFPPLPTS